MLTNLRNTSIIDPSKSPTLLTTKPSASTPVLPTHREPWPRWAFLRSSSAGQSASPPLGGLRWVSLPNSCHALSHNKSLRDLLFLFRDDVTHYQWRFDRYNICLIFFFLLLFFSFLSFFFFFSSIKFKFFLF